MPFLRPHEVAVVARVQRTRLGRALVLPARLYSVFGENGVGWALLGVLGAALDPSRWTVWLLSASALVVAQLLSTAAKRVIRRPRPGAVFEADGSYDLHAPGGYVKSTDGPVIVYARAQSRLSFPSSHSSTTAAAAVVYSALLPGLWPLAIVLVLAMGASRVLLGMHFPTDVLAGFALGLVVGISAVLLLH